MDEKSIRRDERRRVLAIQKLAYDEGVSAMAETLIDGGYTEDEARGLILSNSKGRKMLQEHGGAAFSATAEASASQTQTQIAERLIETMRAGFGKPRKATPDELADILVGALKAKATVIA